MAQELPEIFVGETRLLGTPCAFGTAWPFPLLFTGRWATFPGWGCAFLQQGAGRAG